KELQLLRDKVKDFKEKEQSYQQRTKELMDSSKEKELQFTQKIENSLNEKEKLRNQVEQLNLEGIEKEKSFRKQVDEFKDVIKDTKQQLEIYKQEKMKLSDEIEQLKVKLKEQENMYKQLEASINDSKQKITPPQKTANEVPKFQFPYDLIKQRQNKIEVQENIQYHRLNPQHQNPNHNWQKLSSNTAPTTLKQGHEN